MSSRWLVLISLWIGLTAHAEIEYGKEGNAPEIVPHRSALSRNVFDPPLPKGQFIESEILNETDPERLEDAILRLGWYGHFEAWPIQLLTDLLLGRRSLSVETRARGRQIIPQALAILALDEGPQLRQKIAQDLLTAAETSREAESGAMALALGRLLDRDVAVEARVIERVTQKRISASVITALFHYFIGQTVNPAALTDAARVWLDDTKFPDTSLAAAEYLIRRGQHEDEAIGMVTSPAFWRSLRGKGPERVVTALLACPYPDAVPHRFLRESLKSPDLNLDRKMAIAVWLMRKRAASSAWITYYAARAAKTLVKSGELSVAMTMWKEWSDQPGVIDALWDAFQDSSEGGRMLLAPLLETLLASRYASSDREYGIENCSRSLSNHGRDASRDSWRSFK